MLVDPHQVLTKALKASNVLMIPCKKASVILYGYGHSDPVSHPITRYADMQPDGAKVNLTGGMCARYGTIVRTPMVRASDGEIRRSLSRRGDERTAGS